MLSRLRAERGFTLTEVLAASVMLLVGLLGVVAMVDFANLETGRNRDRETANNLARQVTETAKKVPFSAATAMGIASTLKAQPGLADIDPLTSNWEIESRGVKFEVLVNVCSVDDPKDGYGSHSTGTWCSGTAGTADDSPEDYRRMTVTLDPLTGTTADKKTSLTSFIADSRSGTAGSGGSGSSELGEGFAILMDGLCTGCDQEAWTNYGQVAPCETFSSTVNATVNCLPTYNGAAGTNYTGNQITSVPVKAIFTSDVATAKFFVTRWGEYWHSFAIAQVFPTPELLGFGTPVSGEPRAWTYNWGLANTYPNQTPDGLYDIRAIGYDSNGDQVGNTLVLSFWLNRFVPDMSFYTVRAGRDQLWCTTGCPSTSATPEIEWSPKTSGARRDFDVRDLKVFRTGNLTLNICTMGETTWRVAFKSSTLFGHHTNTTRCRDTRTPAPATAVSPGVTYTMRATSYSPTGMAETEGGNYQTSSNINTSPVNARPSAPTSPAVNWYTNPQGTKYIRMTWTNPAGRGDTSAAPDCITSYRIHRSANAASSLPAGGAALGRSAGGVASPAPCSATPTTSWINPAAGGWVSGQQKFWLTAVDSYNNESVPVAAPTLLPAP